MKRFQVTAKNIKNYKPPDNTVTDVSISKHIVEMRVMQRRCCNLRTFKRLNKEEYVDLRTGEVKQYRHQQNKKNPIRNLNHAFDRLRQLINANFTGEINELHVTLTYAEKMKDFDTVSNDFKKFWIKLRYHYPDLEFIRIIEPQYTGTWHIHVLLKSQQYMYLTIDKQELESLWNHGFVWVGKITDNDNIGAYFTALHKNINTFEDDSKERSGRRCIVKNARLQFYPPNKRFYSYSKGISKPKIFRTTYGNAMKLVKMENLTYSSAKEICVTDLETNREMTVNQIGRFQFNAKRNRKDD